MKNKLTLSIIVLVALSLYLFNSISAVNQHTATKPITSHTEAVETYSYIITSIDENGITGDSLTDDTGIFLTNENVKGLSLHESDKIQVSFPKGEWDVITKVVKINN
jgi:hypothetical protein